MYHLRYPRSRHFMTWDEIGCLCRALGFPVDLIRRGLDSDVTDVTDVQLDTKRGLEVRILLRLLNHRLMYRALHQTYNMHTADWNKRAFTRALHLLGHRALDFDGVHRVRVAYSTYEHMDMKGMSFHKQVLLRALKMCGRAIAPLKLVRQVKRARSGWVEKGRVQLDEFFGLILWCDLYTEYRHDASQTDPVKEDDLFKLEDFQTLVRHHDQRLTKQLNDTYLREERTFEVGQFGPRGLFQDSTVNVDFRKDQVMFHKDKFRCLKDQINQSQQRVQSAHAGSVRPRPISAPDLNKYRDRKSDYRGSATTRLTFESMRRRAVSGSVRENTTGPTRPQVHQGARVMTPRAVTPADLRDVKVKMDDLQFDISTLVTRRRIQVENEMMFYIPGHVDKLSSQVLDAVDDPLLKRETKQQHRTTEMMGLSARPASTPFPGRARTCGIGFRKGWLPPSRLQV